MAITKQELRKRFNIWLGGAFDSQNKKYSPDQTNRWVLCYNGEVTGTLDGDCFDCACCLCNEELDSCGCICHERVKQIVDFFYRQLVENK